MHTFTSLVPSNEEFFEGFKCPQAHISFGEVDWSFDMYTVSSNLLIVKNSLVPDFLEKVIRNYEDTEGFAVITKVEGDNFTILMTFTNDYDNCLHHYVNLHNEDVIQLLDDSTSNNDCVRAFQYLADQQDDMTLSDYKEMHSLLKSQLSKAGLDELNQFAPELL